MIKMKRIDCRGLKCPEPVLKTKKALEEEPSLDIEIVVDNETARENVLRFAHSRGRRANWSDQEGLFNINIKSASGLNDAQIKTNSPSDEEAKPVVFISTDQLGQGSSELGHILMRSFIYTLTQRDDLPGALVLMNSGVKLSIEGSEVIGELDQLQNRGVQILVCGTCLDYYQLKDKQRAGRVSNMYDIADLIFAADKLISI